MTKKKATLTLDEDVWEQAKIRVIRERSSLSAIVNDLLKEWLEG